MAQTIFERYGGFSVVRKVVSDFYDRVLESDAAHHFATVEMRALIDHQTAFISSLMGGPGTNYTDEALGRIHARLDITDAEFDQTLAILGETLEDHGFEPEDVAHLAGKFADRRPVIVRGPAPS